MDDASLEDFLDSEADDGDGSETDDDAEAADTADARADDDAEGVDPAETTYQWTPDGVDCAVCGSTVTQRWHSEDGLVCADCKEW